MWNKSSLRHTIKYYSMMLIIALTLIGCGTKKQVVDDSGDAGKTISVATNSSAASNAMRTECLNKLKQNTISAANIVSNIDFRLKSGSKDISVDGKLYMRKDDVIRIQLSPMGMIEVGRIEFTKDAVLFMDRIHKQYVKGRYEDVGFLKDNGLDFYSLQSLFWNQLYVVGGKSKDVVTVSKPAASVWKIQYDRDKMDYAWWAEVVSGLIKESELTYHSSNHGTSQLKWTYDKFKSFGKGQFPSSHQIMFKNKKKDITLYLTLKNMKNETKWDTRTQVPSKYKLVSIDEVLTKITNL